MKGYFDEEILKKRSDTSLLGLMLPFLKPYRKLISISVVTIILITLLNLLIPYITMYAIDSYIVPKENSVKTDNSKIQKRYLYFEKEKDGVKSIVKKYNDIISEEKGRYKILYEDLIRLDKEDLLVIRKDDIKGVTYAAFFLLIVIIFSFILEFAQMMIIQLIGQNIMHDFRMKIFDHIQSKDIEYFTKNNVGRLVTRVTNDVSNMQEMFTSILTFVFKDFLMLFGIVFILISINPKLSIVSLLALPVILIVAFVFARYSRESFRTLRLKIAEINSRFSETIGGMNIIQLFRQERRNYERLKKLNNENYEAGLKQIHIFALFMPSIELLGTITLALIIFYGGNLVLEENLSIGVLVAFTSYLRMFFRPIRDIAEKYNILQNALSSAERIFLIFDDRITGEESFRSGDLDLENIDKIEFEKVSFSYNDNSSVLKDISFTVHKGETIAIVGPTGSGKTTLINLIERFYNINGGDIKINDRSINDYSISSIRKKTAVVMQNPFLFSSSIKENIVGINNISDSEFKDIVEDANADQIIEKLGNGADTVLSEEGDSLSSGERQLISIARAFAQNPELIILDEATSYVDSASEMKIQKALKKLMENRTTIVVAHRLLTARNADKILVLKNGRLIETGTHEELMEKRGFYHKLKLLE